MLRGLALVLLGWLLLRAFREAPAPVQLSVGAADLRPELPRWSSAVHPATLHVELDGDVPPYQRDWLAALRRSGTAITWAGSGPAALALAADPVADPSGGTIGWIAAPAGARGILEDPVGVIDSVVSGGQGARMLVRSGPSRLRLRVGESSAESAVGDSLRLGKLLVIGKAGWEAKFVAAALEERGWVIDARFLLSPRSDVRQGASALLDTARYAAVLLLDSVPVDAGALVRYARSGGGVLLTGASARTRGLEALLPGTVGVPVPAREPFDSAAPDPRQSLGLLPVSPRADAIVVERRMDLPAIAGRRLGRGRVLLVGYQDTWRWRMGGGNGAVEAHRDWWAGLVAAIAYAPRMPVRSAPLDEAPRIGVFERLGAPGEASASRQAAVVPDSLLFGLLLALLLGEWALRRLRGAP